MTPMIVDLFAGGGGASEGIRRATGRSPDVAINHDENAVSMHAANHPETLHLCESVFTVDPRRVVGRRGVSLLWASPDCTHFSRARGGAPRSPRVRGLAWMVVEWAAMVRPRVICLENVPEFQGWGPLHEDGPDEGQPIKGREGETFRSWVGALKILGYRVEWRVLCAADYGAPTTRRRWFCVARCDGKPIVWPEPTHGKGRAPPWRAAAECIDWSIPCPSIFERKKPLAEATQRRIAEGMRRFVLGPDARPFVVRIGQQSSDSGKVRGADEGLSTITSKAEHLLVAPYLANTRNGEREGQRPRVRDISDPTPTITAVGSQGAIVAAFLARHYGGGPNGSPAPGLPLDGPAATVTAQDHHGLAAVFLDKLHGSALAGQPVDEPAPTVTGGGGRGGGHAALVAAFLIQYYGSGGQHAQLDEPMRTIVGKARMGLVTATIDGTEYAVVDIGMRMLEPRELARAQGFADDYLLVGTAKSSQSKAAQVARIGNSVPPPVAEAIVRANL